jgi:hypothetical protein
MGHHASRRGVLSTIAALVAGKALAEPPVTIEVPVIHHGERQSNDGITVFPDTARSLTPNETFSGHIVPDGTVVVDPAPTGTNLSTDDTPLDADGWPACDRKSECRFVAMFDMSTTLDLVFRAPCIEASVVNREGVTVDHTTCPPPPPTYSHWICQTCKASFYKQDPQGVAR